MHMNSTFLPQNIIYLVLSVTSHICAGLFLAKPRCKRVATAAIWIAYALVFTVLLAMNSSAVFFITFALHFVLFFSTTRGNRYEKCFLFLIYACIYTCFSTVFANLNFIIQNTAILIVAALCIAAIMQTILYKVLLPAFRQVTPYVKSNWVGYYSVVIIFFALIVIQSVFPALAPFTVKESVVFIITVVAFFISCTAIFRSMSHIAELECEKRKQIQTQLLLAQVDAQTKEVETARRNRHDMRHHNSMLLEYARSGNLDSIISYLEKQVSYMDNTKTEHYCENDTVNSILHVYHAKANQNGVEIKIRAGVKKHLGIDYPDLVAVVANALENALNGALASGSESRWISVGFHHKDERLVFTCKNSCSDQLKFEEMPDNLCGIGVKSICAAADKYNGNTRFAACDGVFECLVVMDAQN